MECDSLTEYLDLKMLYYSIKGLKIPKHDEPGYQGKGQKEEEEEATLH